MYDSTRSFQIPFCNLKDKKSYVSLFRRLYSYNIKIFSVIMCLFTVTLTERSLPYLFAKINITETHVMKFSFIFCLYLILNKDNFLCSCSGVLHLYLLVKNKNNNFLSINYCIAKPESSFKCFCAYTKRNNRSGTTQFYVPFYASVHEYRLRRISRKK